MKRVLIISSNRLGDAILSSGLNNYFKEKYKDSQITFVCGEIPYDLFRYCKDIDTIVPFKKKRYSFHWVILFIKIFFKSWEEVIDLRGSVISFLLFTKKRKIFRKNTLRSMHKVEEITTNITGKLVEPKINLLKVNFKNKFR
jgi:lipopolysaccharide export system permease protein